MTTALAVDLARWLVRAGREALPASVAACLHDEAGAQLLAQTAHAHGLAPWLHVCARQAGLSLPSSLAGGLSEAYHANLARAAYFYQELARVAAIAQSLGIELLALKGVHVAATLYPTIAARPMVDIDLLARREHVQRLVQALAAQGYAEVIRDPRPGADRQFEIQARLVRAGRRDYGCVSVHWDLLDFPFYQRRLRLDEFWARAIQRDLSGVRLGVMADEELLVYLAAHVALHHRWVRRIWLCDLALLVDRELSSLDWTRVIATAKANALTLALRETLHRVSADFALPIPEPVRAELAAAPVSAQERLAWQELTQAARGVGRRFWADLRATNGVRARLAFAFTNLAPSPDYMRRRYGLSRGGQLPMAYVRRLLSGLASFWPQLRS